MTPNEELRHVQSGPDHGERAPGLGTVDVLMISAGSAALVLERCKEVMTAVLEHSGPPWPSTADWRSILPSWFLDRCAAEMSADEAERWLTQWRALPQHERDAVTRQQTWSLTNWLYWFEPTRREWYWWSAGVRDADTLVLQIQVDGWPVPTGALEWLSLASGATGIEVG